METIEITQNIPEIAPNQIAFDLDNLPLPEFEEEEESSVLPEEALSPQNYEAIASDVLFVIVKVASDNVFSRFDTSLCGRPMIDWVSMAGGACEKKIINEKENIIEALKAIQTEKPYIAAFYSDTPLMDKNTVCKIIDYFTRNRLNAMTLLRGYIFKTSYLKSVENFMLGCLDKFDEKAFMKIVDNVTIAKANKILQNRIFDYHEKNGVAIFDKTSTVIDADVEIESGVIIKANNIIKGNTFVGKNTILQENNVISNSIIGENCSLLACKIFDSKITEDSELLGQNIFSDQF